MASSKPTIVIIHGNWHSPEHFSPLVNDLSTHGYKTVSVTLPSIHYASLKQPPPTGLTEDIDAIRNTALSELTSHPTVDVVLLTHSYSSVPGSAAIQSLDIPSRRADRHSNGIAALLIIAGLFIPAGITLLGPSGGQVPPVMKLFTAKPATAANREAAEITFSGPAAEPGPVALFYHDLPVAEAEHYASLLKPAVWAPHLDTVPFTGYVVVPVFYLMCEDDRALPAAFQRELIAAANKEIAKVARPQAQINVSSINSGHSPYLSRVAETAAWVRRCVGEEV